MSLNRIRNSKHNRLYRVMGTWVLLIVMLCVSLLPSFDSSADGIKGNVNYNIVDNNAIPDPNFSPEGLVLNLNMIKIADAEVVGTQIVVTPLDSFVQKYQLNADDFFKDTAEARKTYCEKTVELLRNESGWEEIELIGQSGVMKELELGVYLIADLDLRNGDYTVSPFIIQVPYTDGRAISYDVTIDFKVFQVIVYCEVYKDTIKRTSAAYESLPGKEDINNVGVETYRVDINFRSTSSVNADEFIVDDPLECVRLGQVRIESIWTPVVFGDIDGTYYIWYKTNKTDDTTVYSEKRASTVDNPEYTHTGFKLWDNGAQGSSMDSPFSTNIRVKLDVKDLNGGKGLDDDEYITALRFDYGAVEVGFTSMNTARTSKNDEHRDTSKGEFTLPSVNDDEIDRIENNNIVGQNTKKDTIFASLWNLFSINANAAGYMVGDNYPNSIDGNTVDWTPSQKRHDWNPEAEKATGLQPITYMVSATKAMEDAEIVSSAIARIARDTLVDADQDAIVTKVIPTLQFEETPIPEPPADQPFPERGRVTNPRLRSETAQRNPNVRTRPQTGDETNIILYILLGVGAVSLVVVLLVLRKKAQKKVEVTVENDQTTTRLEE